ncbi:MAG: peptide-methionine (R)-S-oxide reductase MsrB [Patescibacteria group bacterium]
MDSKDIITKAEEEWRKELPPELYHIAREKGTERAFTGKYYKTKDTGMYVCAACGQELFSSETKFDSGTGWPSFTDPVNREHIKFEEDHEHGMMRTEVQCGRCGAHLGHVFDDGPTKMPDGAPASGKRFCINSVSLDLKKQE